MADLAELSVGRTVGEVFGDVYGGVDELIKRLETMRVADSTLVGDTPLRLINGAGPEGAYVGKRTGNWYRSDHLWVSTPERMLALLSLKRVTDGGNTFIRPGGVNAFRDQESQADFGLGCGERGVTFRLGALGVRQTRGPGSSIFPVGTMTHRADTRLEELRQQELERVVEVVNGIQGSVVTAERILKGEDPNEVLRSIRVLDEHVSA